MRYCILCLVVFLFANCKADKIAYNTFTGSTMGTTYSIIVESDDPKSIKHNVDNLLVQVNAALSTYESESVITKFNTAYQDYLHTEDPELNHWFLENYDISAELHKLSNGAFDPTIMSVVNYYGFGPDARDTTKPFDIKKIAALMKHVGFDKLTKKDKKIIKLDTLAELDFSGVAKGYGVDKVAELLDQENINNYYVEIGGELYAKGVNEDGEIWRTGISLPKKGASSEEFYQIIEVSGKGIATSGNYRNFYEWGGQYFSHTMNPKTGFSEMSNLIGATIIAPTCALADGYATACMVLGLEKSIELINSQEEIEGILIYSNDDHELESYDSTKK